MNPRAFIKRELKYSLGKNRPVLLFIKIQLLLLCFCIGFVFMNISTELSVQNSYESVRVTEFSGKECLISYTGAGTGIVVTEIENAANAVSRFKRFAAELEGLEGVDILYSRFDNSLISISGKNIRDVCGTEAAPIFIPSKIPEGYSSDDCYSDPELLAKCVSDNLYYNMEALCISPEYFEVFNVKPELGTVYTAEDTVMHTRNDILPVIMGHDYIGILEIGDIVTIMPVFYGEVDVLYRVVGFLAENTSFITSNNELVNVDSSFVYSFPRPEFAPANDVERVFIRECYSVYKQDIVVTEKNTDIDAAQLALNDIADKANIPRLYISGAYHFAPSIINGLNSYEYNILLFILLSVLVIFACVSISASVISKLSMNRRDYAVHIIAGGTVGDIKRFIRAEAMYFLRYIYVLLVIVSPVIFVSVLLSSPADGIKYMALFLLGAAAVIAVLYGIICIPIEISFRNFSVSELLRRSE